MNKSAKQLLTWEKIQGAQSSSGFDIPETVSFYISPELKDFFLYSGEQRPEIYLSSKVRKGISTILNIASEEEVEPGLAKLSTDILSGRIQEVIRNYPEEQGDYIYVHARKI